MREAVIHGLPGIALSHYIARGRSIDWALAARLARKVLERLLDRPCEPGTFWNVNLPHLGPDAPEPEIVFCPLDPSPLPLRYRVERDDSYFYCGDYQARARVPSHDVDVCFRGQGRGHPDPDDPRSVLSSDILIRSIARQAFWRSGLG